MGYLEEVFRSAYQRNACNFVMAIFYLVVDYPDFYKMYEALMGNREVEGILADIYTASYYMNNISDPRLAVSMFFDTQRSIGFAVREEFEEYIRRKDSEVTCLRNLFKYRQRDIKKIVIRHTQAYHVGLFFTHPYIRIIL